MNQYTPAWMLEGQTLKPTCPDCGFQADPDDPSKRSVVVLHMTKMHQYAPSAARERMTFEKQK